MGYCKDPFHMKRQTQKGLKHMGMFLRLGAGIASVAVNEVKAQRRAIAKQEATYMRSLMQEERNKIRQIKQAEAAERRLEREQAKAERERQKAAILQSKKQEQERLELEIDSIEKENDLFRNLHFLCSPIISFEDISLELENCKREQENLSCNNLFKTEYPKDIEFKRIATEEANKKYDPTDLGNAIRITKEKLREIKFEEEEPTIENIRIELAKQAKLEIKSFWPWKAKRLRVEFVNSQIDTLFSSRHKAWDEKRHKYQIARKELNDILEKQEKELTELRLTRMDFFQRRTQELFEGEIKRWTEERNLFFETYRKNLLNAIDGGEEYIIDAINIAIELDTNELPFEYFVDIAYDELKGRIIVNLDLPEIEDIPERKIVLTPTGKKSIRKKSQTDIRMDYVNCVFGLAIYVADIIFNISLQVKEVEISAFTQRKDNNSMTISNHYVYLVNFSREIFSTINFNQLSSLQIMDLFRHYCNMTKSFDLKTIDISTAHSKMGAF